MSGERASRKNKGIGRRILRFARAPLRRTPALVARCRAAFTAARVAYRQALTEGLATSADAAASFDPALASYYANLEVPYGSDLGAVARAWKELVKKYHPDLHAGDPRRQALANQVLQGLNRAYAELERRLTPGASAPARS